MDRIEHVVVIMLENRGFDSVLGYLYDRNDPPRHVVPHLDPHDVPFDGLDFVADRDILINTMQRGSGPVRGPVRSRA